jgi:hypothetical protein
MIIGQICIKIKSNNIIKFLIGQFDLIMGQINFIWGLIGEKLSLGA